MRALVVLLLILPGCATPEADTLPSKLLLGDELLLVEIDHTPGHEPCQPALKALVVNLRHLTGKAVHVELNEIPDTGGISSEHLPSVAAFHRDRHHNETTVILHIMYLDGVLEGGHTAGRTLHDQQSIAIFPDAYNHARTVRGEASCDVERTVLLHELGHALGLVNRGVPMVHDRMDEPGHSTNPESVMYAVLRIAPDGLLLQELPLGFDRHDIADIRAYQS